jgi:hypothetical protein
MSAAPRTSFFILDGQNDSIFKQNFELMTVLGKYSAWQMTTSKSGLLATHGYSAQ